MAFKLSIVRLAFQSLVCFPAVSGYCPPVIKGYTVDVGYGEPDYFAVSNQEDADQLKTCYDFRQQLLITGYNASGPLVIDGPRHVSELKMALFSSDSNPLFTSVTMPNLVSVGSVHIGSHRNPSQANTTSTNLGVLNFPALKRSAGLIFWWMDYVHTFHAPVLREVGHLWINGASKLHTFNAPDIKPIGAIEISDTPSLKKLPSFATKLKGVVRAIQLSRTGLTDVTFPNVKVLNQLRISGNENLTSINLPSLTDVKDNDFSGRSVIEIEGNNPNLVLSLPKLRTVTADVYLSGLSGIKIPELTIIGKQTKPWEDPGALRVGVRGGWDPSYKKWYIVPIPTYLTNFSAPKLRKVQGIIAFDGSSELTNINLPRLKEVEEIRINNTAALEIEDGIWVPNIRKVDNIHLIGKEPRCNLFESLYCQGKVKANFSCGKFNNEWDSGGLKDWPNFPPSCLEKAELLSTNEQLENDSYFVSWIDEYEIRSEFLLIVGLILVSPVLWWILRRWKLFKRGGWRTAQRIEEESKGATID